MSEFSHLKNKLLAEQVDLGMCNGGLIADRLLSAMP